MGFSSFKKIPACERATCLLDQASIAQVSMVQTCLLHGAEWGQISTFNISLGVVLTSVFGGQAH
jgi:hypothetical protein